MKIAHITESFSPVSETFIYDLVVGLQNAGHENRVFTFRRLNEGTRPYDAVTVLNPPGRLTPQRIQNSIRRRLGEISIQEQLFPIARQQAYSWLVETNPDVVYAHFGPMGVMIAPVVKKLGLPLVVSFMGYDASRLLRSRRWRKHYLNLDRDVSAVVGISNFVCSQLSRAGFERSKIHRIPLGVNPHLFTAGQHANEQGAAPVVCLHVGRLTAVKSPVRLLSAFLIARDELAPEIPIVLKIAGDGELRNELRYEIAKSQLEDEVCCLGAVHHSSVMRLVQEADIYTQYAETTQDGAIEGLGLSFIEASAAGLPIVSTRHGGITDIVVENETGLLVDEGDLQGFADCIVTLARQPELRKAFGIAGRHRVEHLFTQDKQIEETISLLKSVSQCRKVSGMEMDG